MHGDMTQDPAQTQGYLCDQPQNGAPVGAFTDPLSFKPTARAQNAERGRQEGQADAACQGHAAGKEGRSGVKGGCCS